ncbi:glycerol-3-phosphate cytidylyltransferase [Dyella soli]|uniref:Glycerol-3-phosphate cytidylyltransferase n=2 Tax=Dyella soli TaxID=522319 RepID=A0A4V2NLK2_9GAMM|nr:glycerol-3-phosphate cytidylyltransferase [Dyella soli]TCI09193.1 glycerol-3-phosphate cytidylyltransferase [Dyella soli]
MSTPELVAVKKTVVLTYGTFDLFHVGHLNLLRNLKRLGDRLIVGVSTDAFNDQKGKKTVIPYEHRVQIVEAVRYVDAVFPESSWEQKAADVRRFGADIFAMGDDWIGKFDDLSELCEVVYLPRTKDISSTEVKSLARQELHSAIDEVAKAADRLNRMIASLADTGR